MKIPANVLLHVAGGGVLGVGHAALVGGVLPGEELEQGGLPAAVDPYQADAVAFLHLKGDVLQNVEVVKAQR